MISWTLRYLDSTVEFPIIHIYYPRAPRSLVNPSHNFISPSVYAFQN